MSVITQDDVTQRFLALPDQIRRARLPDDVPRVEVWIGHVEHPPQGRRVPASAASCRE